MFELMSAVTMVAGLQAAPEQIKIAQILERYEKAAMEPKALRIEFKRTMTDTIQDTKMERRGLFALERNNKGLSFSLHSADPTPYEQSEFYSFVDSCFVFRGFILSNITRVLKVNERERDIFFDYWVRTSFPLNDVGLFVRDHSIQLIKEDEYYNYVWAIPTSRSQMSTEYDRVGIVFMRKQTDNLPAGALRRLVVNTVSRSQLTYDVEKWESNSTEGDKLFPIVRPTTPPGFKEHEIQVDGRLIRHEPKK